MKKYKIKLVTEVEVEVNNITEIPVAIEEELEITSDSDFLDAITVIEIDTNKSLSRKEVAKIFSITEELN